VGKPQYDREDGWKNKHTRIAADAPHESSDVFHDTARAGTGSQTWKRRAMSPSQPPSARASRTPRTATAGTVAVDTAHRDARPPRGRGAQVPVVLDRYRLHRRLGTGGFGTVWMARDERLERDVAVKILPRERVVGGRFEREARAAARLSHPGIVTLYEAAIDDDGAYLVSELVRGPTLAELLEAGRLSDRDIARITIALCDALAHAHAQGIVHRDVKPSNVLVPARPITPNQIAKLTDFGVARVIGGDTLTRTGDVLGTAAYMAPEQAEGLPTGAPADLYALALVTYEALTGVNPVNAGTAAQRARRLGAYLPPLRRQRRELPRELGRGIDQALRPKPRERGDLADLKASLAAAMPLLDDKAGIVTSPWLSRRRSSAPPEEEIDTARWSDNTSTPDPSDEESNRAADHEPDRDGPPVLRWPARALAAVATAGLTGWICAHLLSGARIAPVAAGLAAGVLIAALPRLGWLILTAVLTVLAAAQGHPGAAIVLILAASLPALLLPLRGASWPLAAAAPALGLMGLAGAWPALAGSVRGPWRRAALGAIGWLWVLLVGAIAGSGLYLRTIPGIPQPHAWIGSVDQAASMMLRPVISSGAPAGAVVWALAALTLPWVRRGRSLQVDIVMVTVWAATFVSATGTVLAIAHPGETLLTTQTAVIGGIAAAVVALTPSILQATRTDRARAVLA
jgi:serine/threonine protein kinase